MSKIGIIIEREYTSRVMKKSFLLLTFLTPLFFAALFVVPVWLSSIQDDTVKNIVVIDQTNEYSQVLKTNEKYTFTFSHQPLEKLKTMQLNPDNKKGQELTAILYIKEDLMLNPSAATLYSDKQLNMELKDYITNKLNEHVRNKKLESYQIPGLKEKIADSKIKVEIPTIKWGADGKEKQASAEVALIVGMIAAFLIYIFIISYGAQVMSGVLQEKTSRIVEVMISSVKPFELMMGKIIGVALVGLTQFTLWIVLTLLISTVAGGLLGIDMGQDTMLITQQAEAMDAQKFSVENMYGLLAGMDFVKIIGLFILYFLFGYLLYASFFAAIGAAVDNETDTQQFSTPITIPIIFALFIAIYGAQNPDGPLVFWFSMIPFTSPVVMIARLPFDVPIWQIATSLALLILTFLASTWLAGKIYRTGILMYGKKVTWKEMGKWIRQD